RLAGAPCSREDYRRSAGESAGDLAHVIATSDHPARRGRLVGGGQIGAALSRHGLYYTRYCVHHARISVYTSPRTTRQIDTRTRGAPDGWSRGVGRLVSRAGSGLRRTANAKKTPGPIFQAPRQRGPREGTRGTKAATRGRECSAVRHTHALAQQCAP